jgi:AAHS family 4-hydroxybenzoate transporter-like MFS transporter
VLSEKERWTSRARWLVALVALTILFDGADNQLLGLVIPRIMSDWHVARSAFAPVVSLGYLGMMIGGAAGGFFGDRLGRRSALLGSVGVFGVMTMLGASATTPASLAILRLLAGLGLGGAMPNAAALSAEYVPARVRAIAVTLTIVCVPLGAALAGAVAIRVLPVYGWPMLFIGGGVVPIAVAAVLAFLLPESPAFRNRLVEQGSAIAAAPALFGRELRRDTIALWAAFFSCLLAVYLGFSWLTSTLTAAGLGASAAAGGITAFNSGGVAGALVGGAAISRFGSRVSMLALAALGAVAAGTLAVIPIAPASVVSVMVMVALMGAAIHGAQTTMFALAAHVYPTPIRASGVGSAVAFGRIGAVLTGYAGSWAMDFGGARAFFGLLALMMAVAFIALASVRRHVPPREVAVRPPA